jgi:hypothetical protein
MPTSLSIQASQVMDATAATADIFIDLLFILRSFFYQLKTDILPWLAT